MDEQPLLSGHARVVNGRGPWQLSGQDNSRGSTCVAAEDQLRVEAEKQLSAAAEEKLPHDQVMEDGSGRQKGMCSFCFLMEGESSIIILRPLPMVWCKPG
jgi:hypothetical protein